MAVQIVIGPEMLYNIDLWTDVFSIFVLLLIGFFATKAYKLTRSKKYLVFSVSFFMIVTGLVLKVTSKFFTMDHVIDKIQIDSIKNFALVLGNSWTIVLFLAYEILILAGYYFFYHVYNRNEPPSTVFLTTFLLALSVLFSYYVNDVFNLTALIILILISAQHWRLYHKNHLGNTALLATSFSLIALKEVSYLLINIDYMFYIVAKAFQIIGFTLLLVTFIMVLVHGKKKEQARHNS